MNLDQREVRALESIADSMKVLANHFRTLGEQAVFAELGIRHMTDSLNSDNGEEN